MITPELSWAILGVVLLVAEVITGTFMLLFLGFAALFTGLITWAGLHGTPYQILVFSLLSALGILFFRKKLRQVLDKGSKYSVDESQMVTLTATLAPGAEGKVQYQGAPWTVINDSPDELQAGQKVVIHKTDGIKLLVRKPQSP